MPIAIQKSSEYFGRYHPAWQKRVLKYNYSSNVYKISNFNSMSNILWVHVSFDKLLKKLLMFKIKSFRGNSRQILENSFMSNISQNQLSTLYQIYCEYMYHFQWYFEKVLKFNIKSFRGNSRQILKNSYMSNISQNQLSTLYQIYCEYMYLW